MIKSEYIIYNFLETVSSENHPIPFSRRGWLTQEAEATHHDTNLTPSTTATRTNRSGSNSHLPHIAVFPHCDFPYTPVWVFVFSAARMALTPTEARPTPPPRPSTPSLMMTLRMRNWRRLLGTAPPCITFPVCCWHWVLLTRWSTGLRLLTQRQPGNIKNY